MPTLLELNLNPTKRTLRQFGFIAFVFFALLSVMAYRELAFGVGLGSSRRLITGALASVGVLSALFSLTVPQANRPLYVGLSVLTFPVGVVVSHLLLALLFFGMFAPLALLMRLGGRDALRRHTRYAAKSYWVKARSARRLQDYFRQF